MSDISFLPREEKPKRPPTDWRRLMAIATLTTLVSLVSLYFGKTIINQSQTQAELASLDVEYDRMKGVLDLQRRVSGVELELQQRQRAVGLFRPPVNFTKALGVLTGSVPPDVVLVSFKVDAKGQMHLAGFAANLTSVARMIATLEASRIYRSVEAVFPSSIFAGASWQDVKSLLGRGPEGPDTPPVRFELNGVVVER